MGMGLVTIALWAFRFALEGSDEDRRWEGGKAMRKAFWEHLSGADRA